MGQGDWSYDVNDHCKLCTCGAKVDESAHSGGEATCMSPATCAVCGQLYGEKDPSNHAGEIEWAQTPYNHSGTYGCCGVTVEDEPHEWIDGTCSVCGYACQHEGGKATCTEHAMCDICGIQYGELDPNNHKASSEWTQEDDRHYHVCEYGCGTHLDEAMCSDGEATCTSPATCEVCGQPYGEIDALLHTNFVKIEGKPATHFAEGNIEYWYCDGCKKYHSDETCVYEISYELTILPMIEHAPDGTGWHFDANSHWQTCECGAKLDMAAHNFSWVIDSEATTTEPGSKHEECTMCGYEKASVEIPATGAGDGGGSGEGGSDETDDEASDSTSSGDKVSDEGSFADGASNGDDSDVNKSGATPQTGDNATVFGVSVAVTAVAALIVAAIAFRATRKQGKRW